jgi:hypothetical protein
MSATSPPAYIKQASSPILQTLVDAPTKRQKPLGTHDAKLLITVSADISHATNYIEKPKKGVRKIKEEGEWYILFALGNWEGKSDALTADRREWKEGRALNITTVIHLLSQKTGHNMHRKRTGSL